MRWIRSAAVYTATIIGVLGISAVGPAQVMQFPVERDVGIDGFPGEEFTNTGAAAQVRGGKFTQHAALFGWSPETKEAMRDFIDSLNFPIEVTFNIFPISGTQGPPGVEVLLETVESLEDWVEGDDAQGCCDNFGWSPGTFAVTHRYAQTFIDDFGVLDESESVPWLNDEDGSEFVFMDINGCAPVACALPNAVNSQAFLPDDWFEDEYVSVVLDEGFVEELLDNEFNVGVRLSARGTGSNWQVAMRERAGGAQAAFLEVRPSVPVCSVRRRLPSVYATNLPLAVTLEVRGVPGSITITEVYPAGFQVSDAGGAVDDPANHTLTFNLTSGGDITYELAVPAGICDDASFSGSYTGPGQFCDGSIRGGDTAQCFGPKSDFRVSEYGAGVQIWFEAEDYFERYDSAGVEVRGVDAAVEPHEFFPVVDRDGAFFKAIARTGDAGGRISYLFDIDATGGAGGTWYFWARVHNPEGRSDNLLVEEDPDDLVIPDGPPFPGGANQTFPDPAGGPDDSFVDGDDRIIEESVTAGFSWISADHREGHTKELIDGENVMHIYHRESGAVRAIWDTFMWTDDVDYLPTDADYLGADVVGAPAVQFVRGDANADGAFNIADATFILNALFASGPAPTCEDAADANADARVNIADGVFVLGALFGGDSQPSEPFPNCGVGEERLGCESFAACP